ncbi:MAG TPA: PVC-type heme-binding CxxCH protein, partial [Verrucomicrobiales bacterium]|nr:PVC-type heme-binding CxxCH protein [Verrucomicrobiales bacterium]
MSASPSCMLFAGLTLWMTAFPPPSVSAAGTLRETGVARIDITPDYPVRLNGFGFRREESEGVQQRIWVKALAIGADEEGPLILLTVDNLGLPREMAEEVARRLKAKTGIARERIAFTFTHTHTAPMLEGTCPTIFSSPIPAEHRTRIARYTREITDALEAAARQALLDRRPARLEHASGEVGFARNRRTEGGPADHSLPLLVVRAPDGTPRAVYLTYACHCVTLSHNLIGGDWAGYAQSAVEDAVPGAVCLVSIGCGSDANPESGVTGDGIEAAAQQGAQIRDEVLRMLGEPMKAIEGRVQARFETLKLPLASPPPVEEWVRAAEGEGPAAYSARWHLSQLGRGRGPARHIDYAVQSWAFGNDLAMIFLAGEVCVDYAIRLRTELDAERLWIHGYSNDFCSYIPSERLLREGGYGGGAEMVYFGLPAAFQPGLEDRIVESARRQLPESFASQANAGVVTEGEDGALDPMESLKRIRVPEGLEARLAAAEPLVEDPVAIDFGNDGRLWVAEMRDYPEGMDGNFAAGGRIRALEDTDGDGVYDRATVFLDGLPFPTEVAAWGEGVLIGSAPEIIYAEDRDGDGRADFRRTLFTGFATHNYHARVNSLRPGLDRWLYGSSGLFGGEIRDAGGRLIDLRHRDFRMDPEQGTIEAVSGNSQQGRVRDAFGEWFGCENGVLARHYPLEEEWLRANPRLVPPPGSVSQIEEGQIRPARLVQLFELSGPQGSVTSACGLDFYRDALLGEEYSGDLFVCEPVHHAVVRLRPVRDGVTWRWERPDAGAETEFFVSEDPWTRPVQVRSGPDGGLWVVDMYRGVIEHPIWIPESVRAGLDMRAGSGRGRIYRIVPKGWEPEAPASVRGWSDEQLGEGMGSRNGTLRDMIQRELQQRDQPQAGEGLRRIVREAEDAGARAQALAMLDTLVLLDGETVMGALGDRHPGVRARALRLAGPRAKEDPRMGEAVSASLTDEHARVRLEAAAAARWLPVETAAPGLARLLLSENDVYVRAAALTAVPPHLAEVLWELAREGGDSWSTSTAALAAELTGWALEDQPEMVTAEFLTEAEERAAMAGGQVLWEFRAGLAEAGRGRESQLAGSSVWLRLRALALGARELAKMDSADPALRKAGLQ